MTPIHRTFVAVFVLIAAGTAAACSRAVEVDNVPLGTPVEVTREDGGVVRGTLTARDDRDLRLAVGRAARSIPRVEIAHVEVVDETTPPVLPAAAKFREFTVPDGTRLALRLESSVGSATSHVNDIVEASLTEPVRVDDVNVLPTGSMVTGVVTVAEPSAKVKGRASLAVLFRSVAVAGRETPTALSASLYQTAASTTRSDAKKIGIPAAGGAIIGAIIGGKKGAGIGAIVGGGAGTAVVLSTAGDDIALPRGTAVTVALDDTLEVRVPIAR
jgi:hypothetical protein